MKLTPFDQLYNSKVATGGSTLGSSTGSNSSSGDLAGGTDVIGQPGDYTVVGLRASVSLASNLTPVSLGDVLTIVQASPAIARFSTPSNSIGSNAMTRTTGGQSRVVLVPTSGTAYTVMVGAGNVWDITLSANCTLSLTGAAANGYESSILLVLRQDGTGGRTVTWPGSVTWAESAPVLSTGPSEVDFILLETFDNGATWYGFPAGGGGTTSPLTTKGDLYSFGSNNARLAVGSNGSGVIADSTATLGVRWTYQAISGELLMQDAVSSPPVPIESDPGGTDWLYADL